MTRIVEGIARFRQPPLGRSQPWSVRPKLGAAQRALRFRVPLIRSADPSLLRPAPVAKETAPSSDSEPLPCQAGGPVLPTFSGSCEKGCSHAGVKRHRRNAEEEGSRSGPGSESPNENQSLSAALRHLLIGHYTIRRVPANAKSFSGPVKTACRAACTTASLATHQAILPIPGQRSFRPFACVPPGVRPPVSSPRVRATCYRLPS
jgi:hypothetical protein